MRYLLTILILLGFMSVANAFMEDENRVKEYLEKGYRLVGTDIMKNHRSNDDEIIYHLQMQGDPTDLVSCLYSLRWNDRTECYRP
tara:strand:- start:18 stop:272 length:255 start_codon:yes stop_codon:yes gene_type:complete